MQTKGFRLALLAGSALYISIPQAKAQTSEEDGASAGRDIIVTARRRDEVLQDIPSTVVAVTSDMLEKNRITRTAEIGQLVPGLTIEGGTGSNAAGAATSIRGVATFSTSGATPLVQYYVNDAPGGRGPDFLMPVIYDIGQIEVIKGPQGTLRGLSSPSGAITITTKMPDLSEVGGHIFLSGTEKGNVDVQGAIGIPLVSDVLSLRIAAAYQNTDFDGVKSANARRSPSLITKSGRATLRFEPSPDFQASVMYQYLDAEGRRVPLVAGNGNGRNGPVLAASQRLGIIDGFFFTDNKVHFLTGRFDWTFSGQKLSYVGSYRNAKLNSRTAADTANIVRKIEYYNNTISGEKEHSEELRLSSDERIAGIFDYTVGVFYDRNWGTPQSFQRAAFLAGAFGSPNGVPAEVDPLSRYTIPLLIDINFDRRELSGFGNLTAHLMDDHLELSGGVRYFDSKRNDFTILSTGSAFNAVAFNPAAPCSLIPGGAAVVSPVYGPGVCDVPVPGNPQLAIAQLPANKKKYNTWLYNFSASFKVTDDLMIYANTGSAVRGLAPTSGYIGVTTNAAFATVFPTIASANDLIVHPPETSKNYEVGFKASFLDRRAFFNAALFKQDFKNFIYLGQPTRYASITAPASITNPAVANSSNRVSTFNFTSSAAKASAKGFELEAGMRVNENWSFNLGVTYSKSNLKNSPIPCNDGNFDGTPDAIVPTLNDFLRNGVLVARCRSSGSISRLPNWVLTAQTELKLPVSNGIEAFVRGNMAYRPDNPNASDAIVIQSYLITNMFAGIRDPEGDWELSVFANNAFNKQQILGLDAIDITSSSPATQFFPQGSSGYRGAAFTPRREIGLSLRYAFGAR